MSSTDDVRIHILTAIPIYLHQYVAIIFYIIGNLGNMLCLVIFFKKSWRKNVCVFYFTICLFNDLIFVNSTLLGNIFIMGFNINAQSSNIVLCKLLYYISYVSSIYLPVILILASIDRLLISSQNVDTRLYSSKRLAYFMISISAFLWTAFHLHILIKVKIQEVAPSYYVCYYEISKAYLDFLTYSTFIFISIGPLIMVILSVLAFKNVRRIRAIPRQKRHQLRTMNKKDFQLLRCLYIHNIVYVLCIIVLIAGLVYGAQTALVEQTPMMTATNQFLNNFGSFLRYIPYCSSFFIFLSLSKAFRQESKRMIYKLIGKHFIITREEDQQPPQPQEIPQENIVVSTIELPH